MIKQIDLINKKKFTEMALNKNLKTFIINIIALVILIFIIVYLFVKSN